MFYINKGGHYGFIKPIKRKRTSYQCSTGSDAGKTEEEVEKEIADYQQKGIIKGYKALINWEK